MAASSYRAVQVTSPDKLELVERELVPPPPGTLRIRVLACGVCHSDVAAVSGQYEGLTLPRVPGHEVAGVVDAIGENVPRWKVGERVGIGWNGGYCGYCDHCRRGQFFVCDRAQITGISFDGGYAEYVYAPASAVARMPAGMSAIDSAPLLCAGLTTFNALRNSGARPGDVVAVLGLGGLGHLATQYAKRMGFLTVGIARGKDKEPLARELGADVYIDGEAQDTAAELQKLGGAKVVVATAISGPAIAAAQNGLGINGTLLAIALVPTIEAYPITLLAGNRSIKGWYSGTSIDSEDTLAFSARTGVKPMNEIYPLEEAPQAYARMLSGKARFRVVLKIGEE